MTTLAVYNNNPGNIRPAKGVKYEGMIGVDDKGFAVFENQKFGQQALTRDLTHKLEKRGIRTPAEFVDIYSPAGDENSEDARDNYKIYIAHKLGLKSTTDPFPENAVPKLAQAVATFEGGKWHDDDKEEKKSEDKTEVGAEASGEVPSGEEVPQGGSTEIDGEKAALGAVGAITGAKVAGGFETGKKAVPILQTLYDKATGSDAYMHRPQSQASLQRYANSQLGHDLRVPLSELEKVTGKPIRTMSEVQDAIKQVQAQPRTAKTVSIDPRTGAPRKIFTAPKPAIDLSQFKHVSNMATRAADEVGRGVELIKGALPSAGRIGFGALGGANAAMSGYDAYNEYRKEGFTPRVASKFASTVGGGLSMLPFGVTQIVGAGLQAPELVWSGVDALNEHVKGATKEQADRALTNVDALGNPY